MANLPLPRAVRWFGVTLVVVLVAAGCTTIDESAAPTDRSTDNNRDGVPDDPAIDDTPLDGGATNRSVDSTQPLVPDGNLTTSS